MNEESIFAAALKYKDPQQRAAFLDEACGQDQGLRARVEALLRSHEEAEGFLRPPEATRQFAEMAEGPGATIGHYKLLQEIGEGGMGVVYMAEQQEPVRRKVALKIIKPGMDSRQVIARFEAERQALALMDHPNIARVLDAGTTDTGRPYFVMELVKGIPITEYCDQNQLSSEQRLELFVAACRAVQHAHQKGIIHRDIKPNNVMVTLHDGVPVPKIIDFGVAKAIDRQLTERTLFTEYAQLIGTPLYMSPEQAEMSGLDVDTRTDIYSLGVLLYELLTGTTPFNKEQLRQAAYDEIRRIIREVEPPMPSTRLSTLGDELTRVCDRRRTDPRRLGQLVRGDLDWIVMKSLDKDRTRRYGTASEFADDVRRHLHDQPVIAGPPSATYKMRKFLVRRRGPVLAAALLLAVVVAGSAGSFLLYLRAEEQRRKADVARHQAQAQSQQLAVALSDKDRALSDRSAALTEKTDALAQKEAALLEKSQALERSEGRRLATQALLAVKDQPDLAAALAVEAGRRTRDPTTNEAIHTVMKRMTVAEQFQTEARPWLHFISGGLISLDDDQQIHVWDTATGEAVRTFVLADDRVRRVAVDPQEKWLAAVGEEGALNIWDLEAGNELTLPIAAGTHVSHVVFSPMRNRVALSSATADSPESKYQIGVWNLSTGQRTFDFAGEQPISSMNFSPAGDKLVASTVGHRHVRAWDLTANELLMEQEIDDGMPWPTVIFAPGGNQVLDLGRKQIRMMDLAGNDTQEIPFPDERVTHNGHGHAFDYETNLLLTCGVVKGSISHRVSHGSPARLWDLVGPRVKFSVGSSRRQASDAALSPDSRYMAVVLEKHDVEIWDTQTERRVASFVGAGAGIAAIAISPGGKTVATVQGDDIYLWNADDRGVLPLYPNEVYHAEIMDGGRKLAVLNWGVGIEVMDAKTLRPLKEIPIEASWQMGFRSSDRLYFAYCNDVGRFAVRNGGNEVAIIDDQSGQVLQTIERDWNIRSASWDGIFYTSPATVLFLYESGEIELIDTESGSTIRKINGVPGSRGWMRQTFTLSPDHSRVLIDVGQPRQDGGRGYPDPKLQVLNATTGELIREIRYGGHDRNAWLSRAAFSPDNRFLATAFIDEVRGKDGAYYTPIQLWDLETGRQIHTFEGHTHQFWFLQFGPTGRRLISGDTHGFAKIWDVQHKRIIAEIKALDAFVRTAGFNRNGSLVAIGGDDNKTTIWETETGELLMSLPAEAGTNQIAFVADDEAIATVTGTYLRTWPLDPLARLEERGFRPLTDQQRTRLGLEPVRLEQ